MPTPSGCARKTGCRSSCSTSTSPARRPGYWPGSASAPSSNDARGSSQAGSGCDGQGGGSGAPGVFHRAHRQGDDLAARPRAGRRLRQRDAAEPGRQRRRPGAQAPDRPAMGQVAAQGGREGDPRVRSRAQPFQRRQPHPHPAAPAHRGTPPGAGEGDPQVRRGRARGDPPRPHRSDRADQESGARVGGREEAQREGRAEAARRPSRAGGRCGEGERGRDHGSLMADDLLSQIRLNGAVPRHVAIIMDGNGRWARGRDLPRTLGHRAGLKAVREALEGAIEVGLDVLTLFAFSEENWKRPASEISALMDLLEEYVGKEIAELVGQGVKVSVLGDKARLSDSGRAAVERVEHETRNGARIAVNLCISYSSRAEIARAARLLAEEVLRGSRSLEGIDEQALAAHLYTAPWGDPDLLIRTSGEQRISNFLLWQLAYTELYITPVLWPDFNRHTLFEAINDYQRRERRFGKVTAS